MANRFYGIPIEVDNISSIVVGVIVRADARSAVVLGPGVESLGMKAVHSMAIYIDSRAE